MPFARSAKLQITLCCAALLVGGGALVIAGYAPIDRLLEGERRTIAPDVRAQFTNPTSAEVKKVEGKKKSGCGAAGGKCCCASVGKACGCSGGATAAAAGSDNAALMTVVAVGLSAPGGQGMLTGPAAIAAAPKLQPVGE